MIYKTLHRKLKIEEHEPHVLLFIEHDYRFVQTLFSMNLHNKI